MDIKNVFEVDTVNMKKLFADEQEKCFYIPAYQRPYSWKKDDINRMWEDIVYGLEQLGNSEDYITFLGSIITIHDIKHQSIAPIVRGEVPSKVMVIIDGQQRLTTLLLLVLSLDNAIRKKLTKGNEESLGRVLDTLAFVDRMYKSPKNYGLNKSKDYPKIIRAYDDQWATDNQQEQYDSPIARLLKQYITFIEDDKNKKKPFDYCTDGVTEDKESHNEIKSNIKNFKKSIADFLKNKPKIHKIMIEKSALLDVEKSIFEGADGNSGIRQEIVDSSDKQEIFILLLVLRFVLQRVFVADIVAKKEEYAFEMFDSLNTTGDPLTAFETFKPKVVEYVTLEKYFDSDSYQSMNQINNYLTQEPKKRDSITKQLITAFALSENGKTLSKKLREQRIYLRDEYKKTEDKEKEAFLKNLSIVSQFYNIWNLSNKDSGRDIIDKLNGDMTALTCLQFLAKGHIIAIPLLSRFYDKSIVDNSNDDFIGAIKAVAAFFTLWMSARTGTKGIDNCYRKLMSKGIDSPTVKGDDGVQQLQEKIPSFNRKNNKDISLILLQRALRYFLFKEATDKVEIYSKKTWLNRVKKIELYTQSTDVCKLMLIVASDDVAPDSSGIGLVQKARKGVYNALDKGFNYSFFESIEHISPQKNGWDGVDEKAHTLGNLTLLPKSNNSSVSNKLLKEKELMFQALSAKTQKEQEKLLKESKVTFGSSTKDILSQSQHFPYLESLSNLQGWNDDIIEKRTKNLGSIIWDKLAVEWLGFEE